jgi:hypothetical protein
VQTPKPAIATPVTAPAKTIPSSPAKVETKASVPTTNTGEVDGGITKAHRHELVRTTTGLTGKWCDGCKSTLKVSYSCLPCNL